jgi:hypothetical protein
MLESGDIYSYKEIVDYVREMGGYSVVSEMGDQVETMSG